MRTGRTQFPVSFQFLNVWWVKPALIIIGSVVAITAVPPELPLNWLRPILRSQGIGFHWMNVIVFFAASMLFSKLTPSAFRFAPSDRRRAFIMFLIGVLIGVLLHTILSGGRMRVSSMYRRVSFEPLLFSFLMSVVVEMFYRGGIQTYLCRVLMRKITNPKAANIIAGLVIALLTSVVQSYYSYGRVNIMSLLQSNAFLLNAATGIGYSIRPYLCVPIGIRLGFSYVWGLIR